MKDLGYLSHIVTGLILFGVYSMCVVVIDGEHKSSISREGGREVCGDRN